jgi:hypothetical protein
MACPMGYHSLPEATEHPTLDHTSILGLTTVAAVLAIACYAARLLLPTRSAVKIRILFIWHAFSAITHLTLEASYLYHVFFTSMSMFDIAYTPGIHSTPLTPAGTAFINDHKHLHGAFYGTSATAKLWQEYARADKRWGGSDVTIISLELLTVLMMAPLALYVCQLLRKQEYSTAAFWMTVIATGELYGGFMTFAPEWLTGSPNLDTSNFLKFWVYLVLLNGIWVIFPLWTLREAYEMLLHPARAACVVALNGSGKSPGACFIEGDCRASDPRS